MSACIHIFYSKCPIWPSQIWMNKIVFQTQFWNVVLNMGFSLLRIYQHCSMQCCVMTALTLITLNIRDSESKLALLKKNCLRKDLYLCKGVIRCSRLFESTEALPAQEGLWSVEENPERANKLVRGVKNLSARRKGWENQVYSAWKRESVEVAFQ